MQVSVQHHSMEMVQQGRLSQQCTPETTSHSTGLFRIPVYTPDIRRFSCVPQRAHPARRCGYAPVHTRACHVLLRLAPGGGVPEQARQARLEFSDAVQAVLQEACRCAGSATHTVHYQPPVLHLG